MKHTNKFSTKQQAEEILELMKQAQSTPVIAMSSADALSGNDLSSRAWKRVYEEVNQYAQEAGLPKLKDDRDYGIDLTTREFLEEE